MAKKPRGKPPGKSRRKPRPERPLPGCKAFLICEKVIMDRFSNAATLVGLFTEFTVLDFPTYIQSFWLLLQLSDGLLGEYPVEIEVQDLDRGELVHKFPGGKAIFTYRPEKFDVIIQVPALRLDYPSRVYAVVAFVDGRVVAEQKFTVKVFGSGHEQSDDQS